MIGKTPTDIGVLESELQSILNLVDQDGMSENLEVSIDTKDGLKRTALLSGDKIILYNEECILLAYNDITEMKQMQAEMSHLERLNLVGHFGGRDCTRNQESDDNRSGISPVTREQTGIPIT